MAEDPDPKCSKIGEGSSSSSTSSMETGSVDFDFEGRVKALVEEVLKGQKAASGGSTLGEGGVWLQLYQGGVSRCGISGGSCSSSGVGSTAAAGM